MAHRFCQADVRHHRIAVVVRMRFSWAIGSINCEAGFGGRILSPMDTASEAPEGSRTLSRTVCFSVPKTLRDLVQPAH